MWGKVTKDEDESCAMRITPAHAGKSIVIFLYFRSNKDHSRSCGEKPNPDDEPTVCGGSPPLMRGKVNQIFYIAGRAGITPAHAGKSLQMWTLIFS